jgi:hypothetical protein
MTTFEFSSRIDLGARLKGRGHLGPWDGVNIKNEPMLFNCDARAAMEKGGPITRDFLSSLDESIVRREGLVIDSRVHMLMKGWYPCIPGWHHDDVARTREDGQPDYKSAPITWHAMAIVSSVEGLCPTEFAIGDVALREVPLGGVVYKEWDRIVENLCKGGDLARWTVPEARVVVFDSCSFHRGVSATRDGWRFFIRASWRTTRVPTNEVRRQANVYVPIDRINEGW